MFGLSVRDLSAILLRTVDEIRVVTTCDQRAQIYGIDKAPAGSVNVKARE